MPDRVRLGSRWIGRGEPCWIVAEVGANHNGDLARCLSLIDAVHAAGADAVKFQKRDPSMICVPPARQALPRETPWGVLSYAEYRRRLEFGRAEYDEIDRRCRALGLLWFASPWDAPSVEFLMAYDPPCLKVASAGVTDAALLALLAATGRPLIVSTGMADLAVIDQAMTRLPQDRLALLHCTSSYPILDVRELNLRCLPALRRRYGVPVGLSDHSTGVWAPLAAAVLGAAIIEKHLTWSRAAWGTDHAASVEPDGLRRIVRYIRQWELAAGDGVKRVYASEQPALNLRQT